MNDNLMNDIDNVKDPNFLLWMKERVQDNPTIDYSQYNLNQLYNEYINQNSNLKNTESSSQMGSPSMKRVLSNGPVVAPIDSNNQFIRNSNGAYTNWYGIVLTLIFSFAIGYLIAWILLKVR